MPLEASRVQPSTVSENRSAVAADFVDELTFRAWYDRSLPRVYGYLFHRCGRDPEFAEELAQEAFVEAVRSRRRFRGESDAITWVVGIARHKLVDHFRRAERDQRRHAALLARDFARDGLAAFPSPGGSDEIDEALARLPALQRAVLVLHYMDHLPCGMSRAQSGRVRPPRLLSSPGAAMHSAGPSRRQTDERRSAVRALGRP